MSVVVFEIKWSLITNHDLLELTKCRVIVRFYKDNFASEEFQQRMKYGDWVTGVIFLRWLDMKEF